MKILALFDFSDSCAAVVKIATDFAKALGAKLVMLHVAMPESESQDDHSPGARSRKGIAHTLRRAHRTMQLLARERDRLGVPTTALLVSSTTTRGNAAPKILQQIARIKPDLIVVGSRGHGVLHELVLGSVSRAVVRKSICPVLVVPTGLVKTSRTGR